MRPKVMWLSELKGRMLSDHGKRAGRVRFVTFDPERMRVLMLGVRNFFWQRDQVVGWSSVTITPNAVVGKVISPRPAREAIGLSLIPLPVFTVSGTFVGAVINIAFDEQSGDLLKLE